MIYYFIGINIFAFILCFVDKKRAIKRKYRISEGLLLLSCILGGPFGFYLSMQMFRHKTKHLKFTLLVPLLCILWIIIFINVGK